MKNRLFLLTAVLSSFAFVACAPVDGPGASTAIGGQTGYLAGIRTSTGYDGSANPNESSSFWDGDGVQGSPKIRINLAEQRAYYYKGNQLVGVSPVSTGIEGRRTPKGSFKVTQKSPDHKSSLYGVIRNVATGEIVNDDADTRKHRAGPGEVFERAPMPNFMRFNGGIGMHTGFLPGYAASHGCVRMPDKMAKIFFENTPIGTPVIVE
ncbi:L,D-transpeptidase family protein [Roseibacillus persicicus]|uniref:L,D-TPase catalytic domain-containing protein n=1 Tax=Roseibacillus persicicus TaxID=454148 RepID=A0A918TIC6_9BACT|nr:L,D-transpeptidase family protein [Roseibacillus persicicus]MDQ8191243.1 L,D-transpeptidase family protein [Roseibacillus persicicus]GHC46319.1 hypothetical protein GCM10007100_09890 [Roseibacillus persicicus]